MKYAVLALGLFLTGCVNMSGDYEEPKYTVATTISDDTQLRTYAPYVLAEVTLPGGKNDTMREGFKTLAGYIFGGNTVKQEISMTAPVTGQSTEIAMTAPVTGQAAGDSYTIQFMMPSQYTLATLPKPNDERVKLREQPARTMLVQRFSWFMSDSKIDESAQYLLAMATERKLTPVTGKPVVAYFNPPWTLPWLRRNEVMLEVR